MEIKYKKVTVLYAALALGSVLMLKSFTVKPIAQIIEVQSLQKQVNRTGKDIEESIQLSGGTALTGKAGVQDLLLSVLGCISESGCSVISGTPSRKKTPDTCPLYNLDIVFSGSSSGILKAMNAIDSLTASATFETTVSSCHIGAERSSDGRSWSLVCRETIQCLPAMASKTKGTAYHSTSDYCEISFYIPQGRVEKSEGNYINPQAYDYPARHVPQGRLVGHIGSGLDAITIVEINGESIQLHRRDGILLKDFGDSVRIAWKADTLILKQ